MSVILAIVVYTGVILAIVLVCISADRERITPWLSDSRTEEKRSKMEYISLAVAWMILISLILAGLVDVVFWAMKANVPTVSDWVHYTLLQYPWLAWIAAGLAYHLLVDHPVFP